MLDSFIHRHVHMFLTLYSFCVEQKHTNHSFSLLVFTGTKIFYRGSRLQQCVPVPTNNHQLLPASEEDQQTPDQHLVSSMKDMRSSERQMELTADTSRPRTPTGGPGACTLRKKKYL